MTQRNNTNFKLIALVLLLALFLWGGTALASSLSGNITVSAVVHNPLDPKSTPEAPQLSADPAEAFGIYMVQSQHDLLDRELK